jgi:hypothetical protein
LFRRDRCILTRIPTTRTRPRSSRFSLQLDSIHSDLIQWSRCMMC